MISLSTFLQCIQENVDRITRYELGGDGDGGGCDCIGLIIGAVRLAGGAWPGTHGSNWAARNAINELSRIDSASELYLGEIVFKAKEPGDSGWSLPDVYRDSPDQRDYYHVGVVTSVFPLCVTHCTNVEGGIKVDNTLGQWRWGGRLKYVNYDTEPIPAGWRAVVTADNGYPVKMRSGPGKHYSVLASVPLGTVVDVLDNYDDTWAEIRYQGRTGYMMRMFLDEIPGFGGNASSLRDTLLSIRENLMEALKAVNAALEEDETP